MGNILNFEGSKDSIVVCIDRPDGSQHIPLYVVPPNGIKLGDTLKQRIRLESKNRCSPRNVPHDIISVPAIPYTLSGKKTEMPIKRILMGADPDAVVSRDTLWVPEALNIFIQIATTTH